MYKDCWVALPYPVYSGCCVVFASILCTAVAVWHCRYPVVSGCYVVLLLSNSDCSRALPLSYLYQLLYILLLSYVQRLLSGIAPILFLADAVGFCFYLLVIAVGIAPILFAAIVAR